MAARGQPRYNARTPSTSSAGKFLPNRAPIQENSRNLKSNNLRKDYNEADLNVRNLPSLIGTCPFMCPVEERETRERLRDLAVFERLNGDPSKSSPSLAVKKFCRTISTKYVKDSDLRPLPVLEGTLDYLFNLLHSTTRPFEIVHDFLFDRTRSIRQDLSMQNCSGKKVISMYERMVKFHIISHHELRQCSGPTISSTLHRNMDQLKKALTTLFDLYEANRTSQSINTNEAEFHACYVLLHLSSESQGDSLCLWFRQVPLETMKAKEMCFARRILRYYRLGNYKRFIHTTESEASYFQYCILEPYITEVRKLAVSSMNHGGYKLQPIPLSDLSKLLMMTWLDMESFCGDCELEIFIDEEGNKCLSCKQTPLVAPKSTLPKCYPLDSQRFERYYRLGNYKRFIHTTESKASYFQYCILEPYITEVRKLAVSSMNHGGYKLQPIPLSDLSKLLMMTWLDMESFCGGCELKIFIDEEGNKCLSCKQTPLVAPKSTLPKCYPLDSQRFERPSLEL